MRDYGTVHPRFWTGGTGRAIRDLGRDCQLTALYVITSPGANALGLYYLPLPIISHETGISIQGALKTLQSLSEVGFCQYDAPSEWIFVPNMARYQIGERLEPRDNRIKWIKKELANLVKAPFYNDFLNLYREAFHLHDVRPSEAPSEVHRSQDQDQEQDLEHKRINRSQARPKKSKPHFEIWFEEQFKVAYPPAGLGESQEKRALAILRKSKPDEAQCAAYLARLAMWKESASWQNPQYVPGVSKFFTEGRYRSEPSEHSFNGNGATYRNGAVHAPLPSYEDLLARDAAKGGTA